MNKINEIEKMLSEANELLLELKKENLQLKEENLSLQNKIILLEKMIQDLKAPKSKKVTNKNEKTLKQDLDLLKMFTLKKSYRPCLQYIKYENNILTSTDIDTRVIIENKIEGLEQGFYESTMLKEGIKNKVQGVELDEYPTLKEEKFQEYLIVDSVDLYKSLSKVSFAASTQTDNIALNVVRFDFEGEFLTLACTDSYRLITYKICCSFSSKHKLSIYLSVIKALIKDIKGLETKIKINFNTQSNGILIEYLNRKIYSRTIDLAFPNYKGIIEGKRTNKTVFIDKKSFLEKSEKCLLIAKNNQETKGACQFYFENNNLKMVSSDNINNFIEQYLEIKADFTENFRINLNIKFILDHVKTFEGEKIKMEFSEKNGAVFINDNYIIMPLAWRE